MRAKRIYQARNYNQKFKNKTNEMTINDAKLTQFYFKN